MSRTSSLASCSICIVSNEGAYFSFENVYRCIGWGFVSYNLKFSGGLFFPAVFFFSFLSLNIFSPFCSWQFDPP